MAYMVRRGILPRRNLPMTTTLRLVSNPTQVRDNHGTYVREMASAAPGHPLVEVIPYIQAWIAIPDEEGRFRFAPSKFVGYFDMTAETYARMHDKGMDGRVTEKVIAPWVRPLPPEDAAAARDALFEFCARFGKKPNGRCRIVRLADPAAEAAPDRDALLTRLLVEVIKTLPPERQQEVARQLR
jgi:hypothetical protein